MPLFDEGGNTGASYEPAWGPLARLFDKERRGNPNEQDEKPEGKESDEKKKKKTGKWF